MASIRSAPYFHDEHAARGRVSSVWRNLDIALIDIMPKPCPVSEIAFLLDPSSIYRGRSIRVVSGLEPVRSRINSPVHLPKTQGDTNFRSAAMLSALEVSEGAQMFSKTQNVRRAGTRLITFEVLEKGKTIHAMITAEAVLGLDSSGITAVEEKRAIDLLTRDPHFKFASKVVEKYMASGGARGTPDLPVEISTLDINDD